MNKIATLGPKGTYSDQATNKYLRAIGESKNVAYFNSIKQVLGILDNPEYIGILPIENFSEGYISLVLDHLVEAELFIIAEVYLPIQFSLVSLVPTKEEIETLYVQFVAKGQCSEFIDSLSNLDVISTESNIESLDCTVKHEGASAAIVPSNSFSSKYPLVIENVNDYKNNKTRFFVLSSEESKDKMSAQRYKTSIVVLDDNDHPGLLSNILTSFAKREINLTSIISRPTRAEFGKYHFFIDFEGHIEEHKVSETLYEIGNMNNVKYMGSYPKIGE